jgi:hypothetical protein
VIDRITDMPSGREGVPIGPALPLIECGLDAGRADEDVRPLRSSTIGTLSIATAACARREKAAPAHSRAPTRGGRGVAPLRWRTAAPSSPSVRS